MKDFTWKDWLLIVSVTFLLISFLAVEWAYQ